MKYFIVDIRANSGDGYDENYHEWVTGPDGKMLYNVYNMCDCPEDAIVPRELFSCQEWVDAVNLGFKLAKEGYDKMAVVHNIVENED